jgi:hypothetical protein
MSIQRSAPRTSTLDVLDRILDKGVVIDAQVRVSVVGLQLVDIDAHVVVASFDTYVKHAAEVVDAGRRLRVTVVAPPTPLPQVSEPSGGRARARRRRPRRQALTAYRCQNGCAFWRTTSSALRGDVAACPYRSDVVCELRRV